MIQIDNSFFQEEIREGYLVTAEKKALWGIMLDLLSVFQDICSRHNLKYWADGGTLLGAVRHQGFIPWDDDVDILMKREDYDKFCQICQDEIQKPYFLQNWSTDFIGISYSRLMNEDTAYFDVPPQKDMLTKRGISIEIHPCDIMPNDDFLFSAENFNLWNIKREMSVFFSLFKSGKITIEELRQKLDSLIEKYNLECQKYNAVETGIWGCMGITEENFGRKKHFASDGYDEPIMLQFEMFQIPVPRDYEKVLTDIYGDWQIINKNDTNHKTVLFDANKSYKEYIDEAKY